MAFLDVEGNRILIQAPSSPRLTTIMGRLRATQRPDGLWVTKAHRALDVIDALHHARPQRSDAFADLEYEMRYGGTISDVQSCLAMKRGLEAPTVLPRLKKPLYPYQEQAVAFLDRAGAGILADEPGLGKTLQGIAFALLSHGPCLIVCPATAKHVWAREIAAATNATAAVLSGRHEQGIPAAGFVIVNYDILEAHEDALRRHGFGCLIADEVHRCKNIRAKRTKAMVRIADGIPRKVLLSGTLMMNGADDLYPPLRMVRPRVFPEFRPFLDRYTTTRSVRKRVRGRWRSQSIREGSQNLVELHGRMDAFTIRRTLAEVRDDLPELRHTVQSIDLPDDLRATYEARIAELVRDPTGVSGLRMAQAAIDVCIEAKARVLPDLLEERLDLDGRKTLVFSTRLKLLDAAQQRSRLAKSSLRIDGAVPTDTRRVIEESFQQDPMIRLFLGQTRACGEALTLDAADTVVIADADWSPQANEQAVRRALRVNTKHPVEVIWLVVKDTLDEARLSVLQRKANEFATVMAGEVVGEALRLAAPAVAEVAS